MMKCNLLCSLDYFGICWKHNVCSNITKMIFKIYSMLNELAERDLFMYVKPKRSLELIEVVRKGKRYNHHENFFPTSHQ